MPQKPLVVIPLAEIAFIKQREYSAKKMLKNQNVSTLRDKDMVHVMEISLKQNYQDITAQIQNFNY